MGKDVLPSTYCVHIWHASFMHPFLSCFLRTYLQYSSVVQPTKHCGSTFPFSLRGLSCHVPCFPATSTQREKFSQDARNSRPREDRQVTRMQHFRLQSSTLVPALTCTWAAVGGQLWEAPDCMESPIIALAAQIAQYESVSKQYWQIPDFHVAFGVSRHHLFMLTLPYPCEESVPSMKKSQLHTLVAS